MTATEILDPITVAPAPVSAPAPLPPATRRPRGKIAELPKPLRDELNRLLENGSTYDQTAEHMNTTHGLDLNTTNIGNWFNSGYQDYLRHQDFLHEARTIREGAGDMLEQVEVLKLHQAPNQ